MTQKQSIKQVVIVGAGFAGINAAKRLGNQPGVEVSIVDRNNFHLFQPLLYQVATAALSPSEIASPIRGILSPYKNVKVYMGEVSYVDFNSRFVKTDNCDLPYDYLILACGSRQSYFGNDSWSRYAPGLKTVDQALDIRQRVLCAFELAECESDPILRNKFLTFVVVGGGPTGVELAGALAEMSRHSLIKDFRNIDPGQTRILLIEAGPRLLAGFAKNLSTRAEEDLVQLGVEVLTGVAVTKIHADSIELGEKSIDTSTVLWAAGVQPAEITNTLDLDLVFGGRVQVNADLSTPSYPNVFVAGDQSGFADAKGNSLPGTAPVAVQQGQFIAQSILAEIHGKPRRSFTYKDKGQMATIGRNRAIVSTKRFTLKGTIAWWVWLLTHIYYLIGFKNRLFVFGDWAWSYLTFQRGARLITTPKVTDQEN